MFLSFQKNKKTKRSFKRSNALNDFCSVKTYFAKKDKNNLTNVQFSKELRRSDFLITIEEYVGARETPLSITKR